MSTLISAMFYTDLARRYSNGHVPGSKMERQAMTREDECMS